jgi:hypothetical protein
MIKRGFIFAAILMLVLSLTGTSFALESAAPSFQKGNYITPFFIGINTITNDFDIVSGQANPTIKGTTYSNGVDYVNVKVDLKRSSGSSWIIIKSWNKNITISLNKFSFNENYGVSKGYSYKYTAAVKSYKDGVLLDSVTFDSDTIKY